MGMWDWLFGAPRTQQHATLQLPVLAASAELQERRDSTWNPLTGLGGFSDKGSVARPSPFAFQLSDRDLERAYGNGGIAARIIDLLPDEATRKGWAVPEIPASEDQRLNTYDAFADGGKMARLYGGAVGLMVTEDDIPRSVRGTLAFQRNPTAYLAEPLDLERVGAFQAFHIFDPREVQATEIERDVRQPGYRLPRIWSFGADGFSGRVHASRVVWFRGIKRPPSQTWGSFYRRANLAVDDAVLQKLWDDVRRLIETAKGGAVLAQELSQNVLKIQELAPKQAGDQADPFRKVVNRIQQSLGLIGMIVLGPGDEFQKQATPATGFKDLSEGAQAMLTMALGWPRSMLSGEAPGGLSTDDEAGLERERRIISSYQEQRLRRPLEQFYTVVYAAQDGPTSGETPDEWALTFHPLNEPTDQEIANLRKTVMETDTGYITVGVLPANAVTEGRFGAEGWSLDLPEVEPPDPAEEDALTAARKLLEQGADPAVEPPQRGDVRADAYEVEKRGRKWVVLKQATGKPVPGGDHATRAEAVAHLRALYAATAGERGDAISPDSVCIEVPAADPGLRAAVERAIGQSLTVEGALHVTLLFVGKGLDEAAIAEVVQVAGEEAGRATPGTLAAGSIRSFPIGDDGVPIVVEFSDTWAVQALHDVLLARLAHRVTAQQFRTYRPHITLGFAPAPLTVEAIGALAAVDASAVRVPISAVAVQVGDETKAVLPIGQDA
jgi:phage-related protein (TIGR01555 family)